ncbi:ABC transporter ATP-binding protein [Kaistia sp. 32K]|uniref:ABC transporter ATP-binding protein n=1 Tax=Kaistia sp. 32K TaxID=2795690 RepID=UPI0019152E45|nr:oligopeptide/dipeptide ABC transporter ATP-binding protein [Kaistia sp. 32K]BCP51981.1 ABC transporter ATP-binding protein [Kaistia sp. 32K]
MTTPLLIVDRLEKSFAARSSNPFRPSREKLRAVDGISFTVLRGETFGLVGESGCGKSTAARAILRLVEPTGGRVSFDGIDVASLAPEPMRKLRRRMQMVFQDSTGTLDPRMSVRDLVEEPLIVHGIGDARERRGKVDAMLELVGIRPEFADRRPHQFSGGQRQRIGIARALVLEPELVVLDEPISALDVSVQAQILNLLKDLQEKLGVSYVFIVHDLTVAEFFCDRLAVLYLGQVMESGSAKELFADPQHPYTVSLLSAVPRVGAKAGQRIVLEGEVSPLGSGASKGCVFRARCPVGKDRAICAEERPPLRPHGTADHTVACHFPGELSLAPA